MSWRLIDGFSPASRGGVCFVCGTEAKAKEHGVLTTDIYIEAEGDLDVCGSCIKEAADMLGWVSSDAVRQVESDLEELREWAQDAYADLAEKDQIIKTLSIALARSNGAAA